MDAAILAQSDFFVDRSGIQLFRHLDGCVAGMALSMFSGEISSLDNGFTAMESVRRISPVMECNFFKSIASNYLE